MADKQNPDQTKNIELIEIVRGSHAWNTCDGSVRGFVYSPERIKELAEKKYRKNYWKIGALVGAGIGVAAIAGIIGYSFLNTEAPMPQKTIQEDVLSREEALKRYAPKIEYLGVISTYKPPHCNSSKGYVYDDNCEVIGAYELFLKNSSTRLYNQLNTFCWSGGFWDSTLHCFNIDCEEDEKHKEKSCDKKEMMGFKLKDIMDVKGVIVNDEFAYVEITTLEPKLTTVSDMFTEVDEHVADNVDVEELYNTVIDAIRYNIVPTNKHGLLKIKQHKSQKMDDTSPLRMAFYKPTLIGLLDEGILELVIEVDGLNVENNYWVYFSTKDMIRQEINSYPIDILNDFVTNLELKEEREFVLLEWDYSVVKRKIKPDLTKNTPEESILLLYDLVDSFRTVIDYY